ncbi:ribosome biogenesis factor YjgA [Ideonella dechloratans]|uniref:ribosome biogenesis factor YjgA n=1 Tax=Ideonella dechloratans TaxID=36863 RepID=UPI0035AE2CAF
MRAAPSRSAPADSADDFDTDGRPSKSALKRQMHELQALGLALAELPVSRSSKLDLPEQLRDALKEYHRTRSHEGRRRQLQFIGKLMRQIDPEPVREAVAAFKLGSAAETLALHEVERWREELMASDDAVTRWMADHPETDAQQLRNLLRSARKDAGKAAPADGQGQRHGRAYRDLFQLIKSALTAPGTAPAADEDADDEADDE